MKTRKGFLTTGFLIILFLFVSWFIPVLDEGSNYVIEDSLLGIIIFHNLFVLLGYILVAIIFVLLGLKKIVID